MRILYVEDNEVNQALVERVVRAKRYSIVFREEGEDALEVLAEDPNVDLILLDIELAGTFSGLDVIRTLRARNDHRPVVAITAYAMMGDRERILSAGCDQYLPKPLVITDLLNLLEHYEAEIELKAQAGAELPAPAEAVAPAEAAASVEAVASAEAVAVTETAGPAQAASPVKASDSEPDSESARAEAPAEVEPAPAAADAPESGVSKPETAQASPTDTAPVAAVASEPAKNGGAAAQSEAHTPHAAPQPAAAETTPEPASPVEQDEFAKDTLA